MGNAAVIDNDAPITPDVSDKGQGTGKETVSRAEFDRVNRELNEARESEKFWANRAKGGAKEPVREPEDETDPADFIDNSGDKELEGDTAEKLVDELSTQGIKALQKRGFVTAAEARKIAAEVGVKVAQTLIDRTTTKLATDNQLMSQFPDLNNEKSELFKATAVIYQELVALDPNAKKTPATLFAAARVAKAQMKAAEKPAPKRQAETEDEDDVYDRVDEDEGDRRRRVAAQDGSRGGRGPRVDDDTDTMGPQAKAIAKAFGLSDDEAMAAKRRVQGRRR